MPLDAAAAAQLPPGVEDVTLAVRTQPDQQIFVADHSSERALDGLTQERLLDQGRVFAGTYPSVMRLGVTQAERQWWLPAIWPLVTDGSVVIADASQQPSMNNEALDALV